MDRVVRDSDGVSAVIMALVLTALMGMTAAVVDIGLLAHADRLTQNAADAAVLAGVQALPEDTTLAASRASAYASANGDPGDTVVINVVSTDAANDSLQVTVTREVPLLFAPILGIDTGQVTGQAVAQVGSVSSVAGLLPFGVECPVPPCFQFGDPVELKLMSGNNGNWHAIRLDGNGGNVFEQTIVNGSNSAPAIGNWINPEPGNMRGPTVDGIGQRLNGNTQTIDDVVVPPDGTGHRQILDPSSPRFVLIPFVTDFPNGNSAPVQVTGFGVFFLQGVTGQAGVLGTYIDSYIPGGSFGTYNPGLGSQIVHLIS